ncbi:hypothetical protein [Streptomyces olindensis]|uniref:hypothetical protein n=1 Tax=Streptomyces olindensis TaxID=358823 RepID=UPI0033F07684
MEGVEAVERGVHVRLGEELLVDGRADDIAGGRVAAPDQLTVVARHLLVALFNHEHQHDQWIGAVRANGLGHALPPDPDTGLVSRLDGYLVLGPLA